AADLGAEPLAVSRFEDIIALAGRMRDLQTKAALERDLRLVRCEDGRLEIALEPNASKALVGELGRKLSQWTGRRWMVVVSADQGQPTIRAQQDARRVELENDVRSDPLVQAVLAKYPGAEIVAVRAPDSTQVAEAGELSPPDDAPDYPPYDDDDPEGMTDA
ncbi:MAG: DNA polymerase III subunit gamma/tau, partial [Xanthobacteraceae bacterium]|nr:DNA polymerase III subunit gamma/tau [Xanthobacteraceae bacterium]